MTTQIIKETNKTKLYRIIIGSPNSPMAYRSEAYYESVAHFIKENTLIAHMFSQKPKRLLTDWIYAGEVE